MYIKRSTETEDPRRRELILALAAGAFSTILPARLHAQVFGRLPNKLPADQSIFRLSGDVQVNDKAASLQTRIGPGDSNLVQAGAASRCGVEKLQKLGFFCSFLFTLALRSFMMPMSDRTTNVSARPVHREKQIQSNTSKDHN